MSKTPPYLVKAMIGGFYIHLCVCDGRSYLSWVIDEEGNLRTINNALLV